MFKRLWFDDITGWDWRRAHLHGDNWVFIFSSGIYYPPSIHLLIIHHLIENIGPCQKLSNHSNTWMKFKKGTCYKHTIFKRNILHEMDTNCSWFLAAYRAHVTPVNTITWNPFHPKVFLRWSLMLSLMNQKPFASAVPQNTMCCCGTWTTKFLC